MQKELIDRMGWIFLNCVGVGAWWYCTKIILLLYTVELHKMLKSTLLYTGLNNHYSHSINSSSKLVGNFRLGSVLFCWSLNNLESASKEKLFEEMSGDTENYLQKVLVWEKKTSTRAKTGVRFKYTLGTWTD